jgi:aryl-alcohol dehydrogenase-like predicted oxidoreductase
LGGDRQIHRLGFGAMRITGRGIWGEPENRAEALRTLRALRELDVNFVDTADSYGPEVSEKLIREALFPYEGILIATKAGLERPGPDSWVTNGKPEHLIARAKRSRDILGVERIDLWQLHRIDPKVPQDEQFAAVKQLIDTGVVRHAGLSQVSVAEIQAAQEVFAVATVQNRYNLGDRASEDVLVFCEEQGIGFIPWRPLTVGASQVGLVEQIAARRGASSNQIALAWILKRSPVMLPIPGTSKVAHLKENVAAAGIELTTDEFEQLARG